MLDFRTSEDERCSLTPAAMSASGAHLSRLLEKLNVVAPAAVVRTPYANEKPTTWLAERLDTPVLVLPYTIGGHEDVTDLFTLFDTTLTLLEDLQP